jgi:serine/threonine protein kinase
MTSYLAKSYGEAGRIGDGSFGTVVVVFDQDSGRAYAAKVFEEDTAGGGMTAEALRELSFLSLLTQENAPHCVHLHDFTFDLSSARRLVAVMPLFPRDLARAIEAQSLTATERLVVMRGVLRALRYLHDGCSPSIVHRDVKPENVLLDDGSEAHLTDFSCSCFDAQGPSTPPGRRGKGGRTSPRLEDGGPRSDGLSGVLGTPTYIAPEVFRGVRPHVSVDLWSTGVMFLEVAQGRRLPVNRDKAALRLVRAQRAQLSDKPLPLLIQGLLNEDPSLRTSARAALQDRLFQELPRTGPEPVGALEFYSKDAAPSKDEEVAAICKTLGASAPQTLVAARHYKRTYRSGDVGLLCAIACKVYEHAPLDDAEMLALLGTPRRHGDLLEAQEQLLSLMQGCLLVPYPRRG